MPTQVRDFRLAVLLDIEQGYPILDGWLHSLVFPSQADLAVGDLLAVYGRVPHDELWQVLQLRVRDSTSPAGLGAQGWKMQELTTHINQYTAPQATAALPKPGGAGAAAVSPVDLWERVWDGVTYITWGGKTPNSFVVVRPSDPVISIHRWPPNSDWRLVSDEAETASAGAKAFQVELIVMRISLRPRLLELQSGRGVARRLIAAAETRDRALLFRD